MNTLMHKLTLDVPDVLSVCVTVSTDPTVSVDRSYSNVHGYSLYVVEPMAIILT